MADRNILEFDMKPEHARFAVVQVPGGWQVLTEGRRLVKVYKYSVDAEEAAVRLARQAKEAGRVPEVLVQQPHGELRRLPF